MQLMWISETDQSLRRVYFHLVDATDGLTAELGEAGGQPQLSLNGAAWANSSGTLVAIGNGEYYLDLSVAEIASPGVISYRYKSANTAEFQDKIQLVSFDPYDSAKLGLTYLDVLGKAIQQPSAPLGDTPTFEAILAWFAMQMTSYFSCDSQWLYLKDRSGTVIAKRSLSDDDTTLDVGKVQTP